MIFKGLLGAALMMATSAASAGDARFDWFDYQGNDTIYRFVKPTESQYLNPILSGFHPDPGIVRGGDGAYYLVTSTFGWFPGLPVYRSTDLVSWSLIGHAIDRPGMLDFSGLGLSRGVFAPTISYRDGTYYIANTCVDCRGNFIVTAKDPAGPWSDPVWLPDVGGIDPSLFFDDDGRVWLMNNDAPEGEPRYEGHRAIWLREIDPKTFQPISDAHVIIDGGVRPEEKPIWIEGPHIYKRDGWYYLSAAEGGTARGHSQVILRSRTVAGPYTPYEGNPILTQRDLSENRPFPVTSVGHADYVQDDAGNWWATFLGVRPYDTEDHYNTGRETYLLPVRWTPDGWPIILKRDAKVPYLDERPSLPKAAPPSLPTNGNFSYREEFDGATLDGHWISLREGHENWAKLEAGSLVLTPQMLPLGSGRNPSFVARRQQHMTASASTAVTFEPGINQSAGIAAFQNDAFFYALAVTLDDTGNRIVELRRRTGEAHAPDGTALASAPLKGDADAPVRLKIEADGGRYSFLYAEGPDAPWQVLVKDADGTILSTAVAGGFVGAVFGLYASGP
ncbi:glycoside hydrolase family 43 protein [Gimibacter soli]|uniref:Glycoside hydrolase family 43 protein n=1 Tax=Gimibacter soli TaxID=3024400 RepID=A0AAE9XUD0_9PROT|nr:glycoside hydrolase family 43 protein [Gimibacter soli]WCL53703.1 glycoside hydrolase family 43 protein [Gimibacter soli]